MSEHHYTPSPVVEILRQHVPLDATRVLEPAVGDGALLSVFQDLSSGPLDIVAFDVDQTALDVAKSVWTELLLQGSSGDARFENADFLTWANSSGSDYVDYFDLVLMNPPFAAKREGFQRIIAFTQCLAPIDGNKLPVEAVFIAYAIAMLKSGGQLLAVVPSSIIAGDYCAAFRKWMHKELLVEVVYELMPRTFPRIEGAFFVLVGRRRSKEGAKGEVASAGRLILINSRNSNLPRPCLPLRETGAMRMDFQFQWARKALDNIQSVKELDWQRLDKIADIRRGSIAVGLLAQQSGLIIHTTGYRSGVWKWQGNAKAVVLQKGLTARTGDLLVKRVGRRAAASFSLLLAEDCKIPFSECVLSIRLRKGLDPRELLFCARALLAGRFGASLLERGTGAKYLSINHLRTLEVPVNLSKIFPIAFAEYVEAIERLDVQVMNEVESWVRLKLFGCTQINLRQEIEIA